MSFTTGILGIICILATSISSAKTEYTVGVQGLTYKPYSYISSGEYRGIFRDLLDQFAAENNITFKYVAFPIPRLYIEFYNDKLDFKLPANPYWQADIKKQKNFKIYYSKPIYQYTDGVMTLESKAKNKIKVLGIISGFTPREYLERIAAGDVIKKENPNIKGLLEQTIMGRVDGAYTNIAVGKHYLNNILNKKDALVFAEEQAHTRSNYHMSTMRHPEIIKKLNEFLERNKDKILETQKRLDSGNID
jgi:hypothetical protein